MENPSRSLTGEYLYGKPRNIKFEYAHHAALVLFFQNQNDLAEQWGFVLHNLWLVTCYIYFM